MVVASLIVTIVKWLRKAVHKFISQNRFFMLFIVYLLANQAIINKFMVLFICLDSTFFVFVRFYR